MNYEAARERGDKIGFTVSTFDVLHAGHCSMLAEAKAQCDYLVVGLLSDPTVDRPDTKNKPIQSLFERWVQLSSIKYVDEVIPVGCEDDIVDCQLTVQPFVRIVGEEYRGKDFPGCDISHLYYNQRHHSFSSTELRQRIMEADNGTTR